MPSDTSAQVPLTPSELEEWERLARAALDAKEKWGWWKAAENWPMTDSYWAQMCRAKALLAEYCTPARILALLADARQSAELEAEANAAARAARDTPAEDGSRP